MTKILNLTIGIFLVSIIFAIFHILISSWSLITQFKYKILSEKGTYYFDNIDKITENCIIGSMNKNQRNIFFLNNNIWFCQNYKIIELNN